MQTGIGGKSVERDDEGYLMDPADWNEQIAEEFASEAGLGFTEEHHQIVTFMRRYYEEHRIVPDARFVVKYLAVDLGYGPAARNRLFHLFPYGYMQQACKIAGMRRPRTWSTG
ncbi:MAG: TusE/DsrC/DsvC family sulfur relay protein [Acidiferrobacteraceae bacterium]